MLACMSWRNDLVLHAGCTQAVLCSVIPRYACTSWLAVQPEPDTANLHSGNHSGGLQRSRMKP